MPTRFTSPLKPVRILLLADLHGNFPALAAIDKELNAARFDHIINCGDSLVYAPFANDTLTWLSKHKALSILGNTDKKVILLLQDQDFGKPRKPEKRIMYTSTAESLNATSRSSLLSFKASASLDIRGHEKTAGKDLLRIGIFHGSPADPDEFLFTDTPDDRFHELAAHAHCHVIVTGHSHTPYYKYLSGVHFINPGSAGRMFDGDPRASCAILEIEDENIRVHHIRISYNIAEVVAAIRSEKLPEIYATMFLQGRKLN